MFLVHFIYVCGWEEKPLGWKTDVYPENIAVTKIKRFPCRYRVSRLISRRWPVSHINPQFGKSGRYDLKKSISVEQATLSRSKHTHTQRQVLVLLILSATGSKKMHLGGNLRNSVGASLIMDRGVPFSYGIAWRSWQISYDGVMGKYCYWIIMEQRR